MTPARKTITTYPDGRVVEMIEYERPHPYDGLPNAWPPPSSGGLMQKQPCAFDGLPDGNYGLYCPCPRCSPYCL